MIVKNNDSPLYFRAAHDAIRFEHSNKYFEASKAWSQANRLAHNYHNQLWSEYRANFCFMQIQREKYKIEYDEEST